MSVKENRLEKVGQNKSLKDLDNKGDTVTGKKIKIIKI
jgi:hypothetical protein